MMYPAVSDGSLSREAGADGMQEEEWKIRETLARKLPTISYDVS